MRNSKKYLRWAIDTVNDGRPGFIGRYWEEEGYPEIDHPLPVRLFDTRREARDFLRKMKSKTYQAFPRARVARVEVTVEVVQ